MKNMRKADSFFDRPLRSTDSLIRFFRRTQGYQDDREILRHLIRLTSLPDDAKVSDAQEILRRLGSKDKDDDDDEILKVLRSELPPSKKVFVRYLLDPKQNHVFNPEHRNVYMDMTRPLSHYFVASSHNTYLTGNQINSKSSASAISRALIEGIRLIELDCWDSPSGVPMVKHGHALPTAPIKLSSALTAVKLNAFVASPYPVILTIENHCNKKLQSIQSKMLRDILGDRLYVLKEGCKDGFNVFPSPKDLLGRILVRHKIKGIEDSSALMFQDMRSKSPVSTISSSSTNSPPPPLASNSSKTTNKRRGDVPLPSCPALLSTVTIPNVKVKQKTLRAAIESHVALSCSWNENKCKKLRKACPDLVCSSSFFESYIITIIQTHTGTPFHTTTHCTCISSLLSCGFLQFRSSIRVELRCAMCSFEHADIGSYHGYCTSKIQR